MAKSNSSSGAGAPAPGKMNSFVKGMAKDLSDLYLPDGVWSHALNAVNTSHRGDKGLLGNEAGTQFLVNAPMQVIGAVHHSDTQWVIFSTDENLGEIGLFDERLRTYRKVVSSDELGFTKNALITGVTKSEYDTTHTVYWQDGLNPDRCLNLTRVPYRTLPGVNLSLDPSCFVPKYTDELDIDDLLLHPKIKLPTLILTKNPGGGQLPAGSYQVVIAYSVKGIRVTDYFTPSNVASIWSHGGAGGAIKLLAEQLDENFDEYELVLISTLNAQTTAHLVGHYSSRQDVVVLDQVLQSARIIDLAVISLQNPIYHKSEGMHDLNGYLIRSGVSTKPDFNYQPLANLIQTNWVNVSYPASYYAESGINVGYLRDEIYAYFIRWVYDTGLKSASYHIPGRAALTADKQSVTGPNVLTGETERWESEDTSTIETVTNRTTSDGGIVTHKGKMQYWESLEKYPDRQPLVWGTLCGKKLRHHKFPSNERINHFTAGGNSINVLGVEFTNIRHPRDEKGVLLPDVVGYEILRGSREGNKSIIAKGQLSNLGEYTLQGTTLKGLYDNYPYNDLRPDKFLVDRTEVLAGSTNPDDNVLPLGKFQNTQLGFHSPDTTFEKPFLSGCYLQVYNENTGQAKGKFEFVHEHPKQKLLSTKGFVDACIAGLGIAVLGAIGSGSMSSTLEASIIVAGASAGWARTGGEATSIPDAIANCIMNPATTIAGVAIMIAGGAYFAGSGIDKALDIVYNMSPYRQYALQYNSHCFYNQVRPVQTAHRRRSISPGKAMYIGPHVQDFTDTHRINNWARQPFVALKINAPLAYPTAPDTTRQRLQDTGNWNHPTREITSSSSAHYGALKLTSTRQYGQLASVVQVPVHSGTYASALTGTVSSPVIFGGDIYITRFTQKNTYFYFNKWLTSVPNGTGIDLRKGLNGPPARYWADFNKFDLGNMGLGISFDRPSEDSDDLSGDKNGLSVRPGFDVGPVHVRIGLPSDLHHLDQDGNSDGVYTIRDGFIYLSNNGVRDFFVESEKNLAFRDYKNELGGRHHSPYDHYSDLGTLFRADVIKQPELLIYDKSLSVSRLYYNFRTWGSLTGPDFDPLTQESRFSYFPDRAIYSLQHQAGLRRDNWKSYLANNYKDFSGKIINQIKALNATGALILFDNSEPVQFMGVDQLQTTGGVKITVGDGGLFQQGLQSVVNADDSLERGSSQSKRSAVNTPYGLFWISQKTAKVFLYQPGSTPEDISSMGMSRWFGEYLPSKLLEQFPHYPYADNPVAGVGCQSVFDPLYELVYFSKRDFRVKDTHCTRVIYLLGDSTHERGFYLLPAVEADDPEATLSYARGPIQEVYTEIELGDPRYFDDCSWTLSFDPKAETKGWVSFHSWAPDLMIPSYQHFVSIKNKGFHRHNTSVTSYCNYYGVDHPFEIEVPVSTGAEVSVLKSVEYQLEAYTYTEQGRAAFEVLDANFDRAMIYNNEQSSGWLRLVNTPKNSPVARLSYPKVTPTGLEILVSKEEQKYRFNQFWDQTKDRGEFSLARVAQFKWHPSGMTRVLNPLYFDYAKHPTEHKRFRHYAHRLILRKNTSNEINYLLKLTTVKLGGSAR